MVEDLVADMVEQIIGIVLSKDSAKRGAGKFAGLAFEGCFISGQTEDAGVDTSEEEQKHTCDRE